MARARTTPQKWSPPAARIEGERILAAKAAQQRVADAAAAVKEEAAVVEKQVARSLEERIADLEDRISRLTEDLPKIIPAGGGGKRMVAKVLKRDFGVEGRFGSAAGTDASDYATAEQGETADKALSSLAVVPNANLPLRLRRSAWENPTFDWDTALEAGLYGATNETLHNPPGLDWCKGVVVPGDGNNVTQTVWPVYGVDANDTKTWQRDLVTLVPLVFTDWYRLRLSQTEQQAIWDARYATAGQGATADSAVQPSDLASVATSGSAADLDSGILLNDRVSTTLPPDKAFRRGNILGTVLQSAGVPTGAIVERGSNANGSYVRFADGTQICWQSSPTLFTTTSAVGSVFASTTGVFTFSSAFSAAPLVTPSCVLGSSSAPWATLTGVTATTASVVLLGATNTSSGYMGYVAVGRWF